MKKSMVTILSFFALVLAFAPVKMLAQQNNTEVIVIQKVTDKDGATSVDQQTIQKGVSVQTLIEELKIENTDGTDIEINVITDADASEGASFQQITEEGETVFLFRGAKTDSEEDLQSLRITLNKQRELAEKALLGIYPASHAQGVLVTNLVSSGGAKAAGLQRNDIITALAGQTVRSNADLTRILAEHKPGQTIAVTYLRDGQTMQTQSTLTAKRSKSHHRSYNVDPCKVFIGVYTSSTRDGARVSKIIPNTPAAKSNILPGDVITALDDVFVRTHNQLVLERDKHEPGDYFTLTILRDGKTIEVDGQFLSCEEPKEEVIEEPKEEIEEIEEILPEPSQLETPQNTLVLENFNVFPNPTLGPVNLQFNGEAKPTTIRVTDATGKLIYKEVLNNFSGTYSKEIMIDKGMPGTLILTVQQDQQIFTRSLVLMPRA